MQVAPLFSAAEIEARIAALGARLYRDYVDCQLSVVGFGMGADGELRDLDEIGVVVEEV